jgi:sulfur-oxidizing protein SoxX
VAVPTASSWVTGAKAKPIAQSGRGLTWTDEPGQANGGNCYNCHQIDKKEISFGTIGPSLYNYGKIRGVSNPDSPKPPGPSWNTHGARSGIRKAYNACSQHAACRSRRYSE